MSMDRSRFLSVWMVIVIIVSTAVNLQLGAVGFYSLLMGLGISTFFIATTAAVLKLISAKQMKPAPGAMITILMFLSKLPVLFVTGYILMYFMHGELNGFLLGIGLVYSALYFFVLLNTRKA
jgi:hypothetical protein